MEKNKHRLINDINEALKGKKFINIATSNMLGHPNVAPKFLLKVSDRYVFVVDYVIAKTYKNIRKNSRVSLSTVDLEKLNGWQINGRAHVLNKGEEYEVLAREYRKKQIQESATRIVKSIRTGDRSKQYEASLSTNVVIFKIRAHEVIKIYPSGELKKTRSK